MYRSLLLALLVVVGSWVPAQATSRDSHPFVPGMIHVLPKLMQPNVGFSAATLSAGNPLKELGRQMPQVMGLVENFYLGPVYVQSVPEYLSPYGKTYWNSGNYWPIGFEGVDPELGTKQDYINLVAKARALGLGFIQDVCFNYLGYLPQRGQQTQIDHFMSMLDFTGVKAKGVDIHENYYLWGNWVHERDGRYFGVTEGHSDNWGVPGWAWDTIEAENPNPHDLERALRVVQTHDLMGLRRLNHDNPEVVKNMIQDQVWYIRDAKVTGFRIDAAKHMKADVLRAVIDTFNYVARQEVAPTARAQFFLEYWTTKYRNMAKFKHELGPSFPGVYFFDYPLSQAIRSTIIFGETFRSVVGVIDHRKHFGMRMQELVPIWIDHDFGLPVYNGSELSTAQLAAGYWFAFMMSSNAPHFYNGFEKPEYFRDPYQAFPEPARVPFRTLVDHTSKGYRTIRSITEIFLRTDVREILERSQDVFVNHVDDNSVVLERRLEDRRKKLVLRVSRSGDPGRETSGQLVWEYLNPGLSIRAYYMSW